MTDLLLTLATAAKDKGSWLHRMSFGHTGNSTQAAHTENLYIFIVWVNVLGFLLVMVPLLWFVFKYHRSKQAVGYQVSAAHNTPLELSWSIIPLLIMVPIFFWGFEGYLSKLAAPTDSEEIQIVGQKWQWSATYRNGASPPPKEWLTIMESGSAPVPLIVVPKGRPVKLLLRSTDVLHSFFVPDFRTKIDVFPNRYTSMWFQSTEAHKRNPKDGSWYHDEVDGRREFIGHKVFCAEYCGDNHSEMLAGIIVLEPDEYAATLKQWEIPFDDATPPVEIGKIVFAKRACITCHSVDGGKNTGPTWLNWYGYEHTYTDGSTHLADENWLRENILFSQKYIVQGFSSNMPLYAGVLSDLEMHGLIEYIKSLSDKGPYTGDDAAGDPGPEGQTPAN